VLKRSAQYDAVKTHRDTGIVSPDEGERQSDPQSHHAYGKQSRGGRIVGLQFSRDVRPRVAAHLVQLLLSCEHETTPQKQCPSHSGNDPAKRVA